MTKTCSESDKKKGDNRGRTLGYSGKWKGGYQ